MSASNVTLDTMDSVSFSNVQLFSMFSSKRWTNQQIVSLDDFGANLQNFVQCFPILSASLLRNANANTN